MKACAISRAYDADRSRHPGREVRATILDEAKVGARLLDQNRAAAVPGGQFDHLAPEIGVLDPAPKDIGQVIIWPKRHPGQAHPLATRGYSLDKIGSSQNLERVRAAGRCRDEGGARETGTKVMRSRE